MIHIIQVSDDPALCWDTSTPKAAQVSVQAHVGFSLYKGPIDSFFFSGTKPIITNQGDRLPIFVWFMLTCTNANITQQERDINFFLYEVNFSKLSQSERRHQPIMSCKRDVTSQFLRMSDLWLFMFVSNLYCMTNLWRKYDKGEMGWVTSLHRQASVTAAVISTCTLFKSTRLLIKTVILPWKFWCWSTATSIGALVCKFLVWGHVVLQ